MDSHKEFQGLQNPSPAAQTPTPHDNSFFNKNMVVIYTILTIILRMRAQMGLEATLEYVEKHAALLESHNPLMKSAVDQALALMNVEKMYHDAMQESH